jgi:hypothetical protein
VRSRLQHPLAAAHDRQEGHRAMLALLLRLLRLAKAGQNRSG